MSYAVVPIRLVHMVCYLSHRMCCRVSHAMLRIGRTCWWYGVSSIMTYSIMLLAQHKVSTLVMLWVATATATSIVIMISVCGLMIILPTSQTPNRWLGYVLHTTYVSGEHLWCDPAAPHINFRAATRREDVLVWYPQFSITCIQDLDKNVTSASHINGFAIDLKRFTF